MPEVLVSVPLSVELPSGPLMDPDELPLNVADSAPPEMLMVGRSVPDSLNVPVAGHDGGT